MSVGDGIKGPGLYGYLVHNAPFVRNDNIVTQILVNLDSLMIKTLGFCFAALTTASQGAINAGAAKKRTGHYH